MPARHRPDPLTDAMTASKTASETPAWYVVKRLDATCAIAAATEPPAAEHWGPFASRSDAIARRVGLIRAGKCKPQ